MDMSMLIKTNDATTDTHSIFAYKGTTSIWILQTFWQLFFIAQMAKFSKTKRQHTEHMSFDTKKKKPKIFQKSPPLIQEQWGLFYYTSVLSRLKEQIHLTSNI